MYLANKVAITTQNVEIKAVRDRLKEHLALLDIKEYIGTKCSNKYCTNSRLYITDGLKKDLIFKINKALGSDSNE